MAVLLLSLHVHLSYVHNPLMENITTADSSQQRVCAVRNTKLKRWDRFVRVMKTLHPFSWHAGIPLFTQKLIWLCVSLQWRHKAGTNMTPIVHRRSQYSRNKMHACYVRTQVRFHAKHVIPPSTRAVAIMAERRATYRPT